LREKNLILIESREIVPGDVLVLKNKMSVPCDCILISGELFLNEVSLTGESLPIPKEPIESCSQSEELFDPLFFKKNYLFEGTQVLSSKAHQ
jgi:cation-transporting P-type ATPase 13A2